MNEAPRSEDAGDLAPYLRPTDYIDSDHPDVVAFAKKAIGDAEDDIEKAIRLYYAIRDGIRYDPYGVIFTKQGFTASDCLHRGVGFCVLKAALLAATSRAVGIPARLGFADVRNHLTTERLTELMGTDVFFYHGYAELYLDGKWVKATPAFNIELCEKFHVLPLEFDGRTDSIFHPFDADGRQHMEYVADRGQFADMPFEEIRDCFAEHYPSLWVYEKDGGSPGGDFAAEAAAENE